MSCLHDFVAGRVKTQLLTRHDCNIIDWVGKLKLNSNQFQYRVQ